jgi:hypothetical protein
VSDDALIDLHSPLTLRNAFAFPIQSREHRREVLVGGLLLLIPVIGWILNMGHRIMMTHRMQHGLPATPAWRSHRELLKHGFVTFVGMIEYHLPAMVFAVAAWRTGTPALYLVASIAWILATVAVPGYMSHYCFTLDLREVINPFRALRRVMEGGRAYWHAWAIALLALGLSFIGLLALGVGFLFTSVWFWQVAGFSFANVFSHRFNLSELPHNSFTARIDSDLHPSSPASAARARTPR